MNKKLLLPVLILSLLLPGCGKMKTGLFGWWGSSAKVHVGISENFDFTRHKGIAILPFTNVGKRGFDTIVASKFSVHLMEQGFKLADIGVIQRIVEDNQIDLSKEITQESLSRISSISGMPLVGTGEVIWGMDKETNLELRAVSIRLILAETGEVLISGYATVDKDSSASLLISRDIGRKIFDLNEQSGEGS